MRIFIFNVRKIRFDNNFITSPFYDNSRKTNATHKNIGKDEDHVS